MPNIKISIHKNRNLEKRKGNISKWRIVEQDKKDLLKFLNDLSLGKINKGKKISEARQLKYLDVLRTPLEFFNKGTAQLTLKDMERFEKALSTNKIKTYKKTNFATNTKSDMRRLLKIYLRWKLGDTEKYRKLTDWLDTRAVRNTPDYLKEEEIEKLFNACRTNEQRYFIAVLFDSGARAEEFHNIRYEDIQLPKENNNFVKITIKTEFSKTEGRTISLYWRHSLDAIRDYLKEREAEGIKSNEAVFKNDYNNMRMFLARLGKNILNKNVYYHLLRHSSATYYASKINRQQLCYRYGWKFSSDMVDVYISRSGMNNLEVDEKFKSTEIEALRLKLEKIERQRVIDLEDMQKELEAIRKIVGRK